MKRLLRYGPPALVTLMAVLFLSRSGDLASSFAIARTAKPWWLLASALIPLTLGIAFSSTRLHAILFAMEPSVEVGLASLMRMSIVAFAVNHVSTAPAGEAIRCISLFQWGVKVRAAVSSQLFEKLIEVAALALLSAIMLALSAVPGSIVIPIAAFVGCAALLTLAAASIQTLGLVSGDGTSPTATRSALGVAIGNAIGAVADVCRFAVNWRSWIRPLGWSMLADCSNGLCVAASLTALGIPVSPALCFCAVLGIRGAALLPSVPGRFGVQEAGMVIALTAFGVPHDLALSAALLHHVCTLLPMILAACLIQFGTSADVAGWDGISRAFRRNDQPPCANETLQRGEVG